MVVVDAKATQHTQDVVFAADGIFEALENYQSGTRFGTGQIVAKFGIEIDAGHQGDIDGTILQGPAGALEGSEA